MSMPTMTIPHGIRLSGRRMTVVTGALLFALLAAVFAAVYLVTFWSGFRGGDRAMVARPHMEAAVPAGVSGIPDAAGGAEAS
jgi:hypothetical protein